MAFRKVILLFGAIVLAIVDAAQDSPASSECSSTDHMWVTGEKLPAELVRLSGGWLCQVYDNLGSIG